MGCEQSREVRQEIYSFLVFALFAALRFNSLLAAIRSFRGFNLTQGDRQGAG